MKPKEYNPTICGNCANAVTDQGFITECSASRKRALYKYANITAAVVSGNCSRYKPKNAPNLAISVSGSSRV